MTYRASLRGNQVEWQDVIPQQITGDAAVEVYITVVQEDISLPERKQYGKKMAAALEALASLPVRSISDPAAWEREQRQDRKLPQRIT
ncbi:MAG: hypothetical protein GY943_01825 [Chloroflexi bacterium]|nr:hypothetical protein [Chloroflexota bacterium]